MSAKRFFVRGVIGIVLMGVCLSTAFAEEAWEKSAETTYEHGWFMETTGKNPEGALDVYRKLIERFGNDKQYCALAQVRIGACLDALGKGDEARAAWEKVFTDYADQPEAVKNARLLMAGIDPATVGSFEEMKKKVEESLGKSQGMSSRQPIALTVAIAYPDEAADFLHEKLVELGKTYGPAFAQGRTDSIDPYRIRDCLDALATCGTEKARDYLLDLAKHAGDAEGQFLGDKTTEAIVLSFVQLPPRFVTDEMVDIVIKQAKNEEVGKEKVQQFTRPFDRPFANYGENQTLMSNFYCLVVFADSNAKALDYLKATAVDPADGKRGKLAMLFMTRLRKPEMAQFFSGIATGKYPEELRRTAIACLGGIGEPLRLPTKMTWRSDADATLFQFIQWRMSERYSMAGQFYAQQAEPPKIVPPDKALLDECVKGLKAAYDFNNSVAAQQDVISAFEFLGRDAAKGPVLDYLKNAVDPEVREKAAMALADLYSTGDKDADVSAALQAAMKDDPVISVRVQAAWAIGRLQGEPMPQTLAERTLSLTREAIPVVMEALRLYKGAAPATIGMLAINVTAEDGVNALLVTTFHGERIPTAFGGRSYSESTLKAIDDFDTWWDANKDKTDEEWAIAGMDEYVAKGKEYFAKAETDSHAYPPYMAIEQYVQKLVKDVIGQPARSTGADYRKAQLKAVCDWWEANRDKVKWNSEKRCFELKQ